MRVMSMKALRTFGPIILQRMTSYGMTTNIKKVDDRAAHFGQPLSFALCTILCFPYILYINRYIRYVVTIKRYSIFRMVIIILFTL